MALPLVQNVQAPGLSTTGIQELSSLYLNMWSLNGNKSIKKAATRALRKGTTILKRAYVSAAPNGPPKKGKWAQGHVKMRKAVRQRVRRPQRKRPGVAKVGFNVGQKKSSPTWASHAHWPSVGTKPRQHKSGKKVGRVKASNVIGTKVSQKYPAVLRAIEDDFTAYINSLP